MTDPIQANRWRCLATGCNPVMFGETSADRHRQETGHAVAKWPVRSTAGQEVPRFRNETGLPESRTVRDLSLRFVEYGAAIMRVRELHSRIYMTIENEIWGRNPRCKECHDSYPCPTVRILDGQHE